MKKSFKSYLALIPNFYRWLMPLAVPAVLIAANLLMEDVFGFFSVILCVWLYSFLDLFLDFWVFGGICSKSGNKMEYIKSSFYGYELLKRGLIWDEVRRLFGMAVIAFGVFGRYCIFARGAVTSQDLLYLGIIVFFPFSLNTLALNLVRYINNISWHNTVSALVSGISTGMLAGISVMLYGAEQIEERAEIALALIFAGLLVLSAAAFALMLRHMLYKVKKSYLDVG
jgi:hypothetical protein